MRVSEILRTKGTVVHTISGSASVGDALNALAEWGIGAVVVSSDGTTIDGILSERDIVRALQRLGPSVVSEAVDSLMTTEVVTCEPGDQVDAMMSTMTENRFRHMPVVTHGQLTGLISIGDVVAARVAELENTAAALEEYLHQGR